MLSQLVKVNELVFCRKAGKITFEPKIDGTSIKKMPTARRLLEYYPQYLFYTTPN
jgi:hypothetical protein